MKLKIKTIDLVVPYSPPDTFWTNPQFRITIKDSDGDEDNLASLIVSLMQKNRRSMKRHGAQMLTIGYSVYKVT